MSFKYSNYKLYILLILGVLALHLFYLVSEFKIVKSNLQMSSGKISYILDEALRLQNEIQINELLNLLNDSTFHKIEFKSELVKGKYFHVVRGSFDKIKNCFLIVVPMVYNNLKIGTIEATVDLTKLNFRVISQYWWLYLINITFIFFVILLSNRYFLILLRSIENFLIQFQKLASEINLNSEERNIRIEALKNNSALKNSNYKISFEVILNRLLELMEAEVKLISNEKISQMASQVSHDIRSPLSALNMIIGTLINIPEEQRILLRSSTARINDIANQLLNKGKSASKNEEVTKSSIELLPAIVELMVSEKRIQFRTKSNITIDSELGDSYGAFAKINSIEFKRVLSNIINNSIEALNRDDGKITLKVQNLTDKIIVSVCDNGIGIPKSVLSKLGQQGVSHGKEGTDSGSGLGIYHAKKTIESFGATFEIMSQEWQGTEIRMEFPKCEMPKWFVPSLQIAQSQTVIALDDDQSILGIWTQRFKSVEQVNLITFTSDKDFIKFIEADPTLKMNSIFLMDYELLDQENSGLDLIEKLNLSNNAILVTSHYEELKIRERCEKLNVKQIPKAMASLVPFNIINEKVKFEEIINAKNIDLLNREDITKTYITENFETKIRYDLCLLDDDKDLIQSTWGIIAKSKGLNIKMFTMPEEFFAAANSIDKSTPIYIDVSLGNGVNGTDIAKEIHKLGFVEINLATGYEASSIEVPSFIYRVCDKNFPL